MSPGWPRPIDVLADAISSYPTFAAKTFATVDQVSDGRMTVRFITGGTDHEQQREGGYLTKDERYERTRECMQIVKQAWTSKEPLDDEGKHYKFADFVSDVFPVQQPRPRLSFGGSSPAAYAAGGAEADIYCLWGEPLARRILDYIDLGVDIISMRGYDLLQDAIDVGQQVIPLRAGVAKRDAASGAADAA